jgi:hypothetical protein
MSKLKVAAKESAENSGMSKFIDALSAPQKKLSQKAAEMAGLKPESESADNFAAIADLLGDKMGVPRDSTVGNAVKAAGVAGAEMFADPLGFIPVGKAVKGAKAIGAAVKGAKSAMSGADKLAAALKRTAEIGDNIGDGARVVDGKIVQPIKPIEQTKTGDKWSEVARQQSIVPPKKAASNVVSMSDKLKEGKNLKVKEDAKKFAMESVKAELEKQPGLKNNPEYLKRRMQELANFFFAQKRSK